MLPILVVVALVSGASFLYYSYETLFEDRTRVEFHRYGVPGLRRLVGSLQFLGGVGVLLGLWWAPLGAAAAAGLTLMMFLGLMVRVRIHDAPRLMLPAASLAVLNLALMVLFVIR